MHIFTSKQNYFIKSLLAPCGGRARVVVLACGFTEWSIEMSTPKLTGLSIQTLCVL